MKSEVINPANPGLSQKCTSLDLVLPDVFSVTFLKARNVSGTKKMEIFGDATEILNLLNIQRLKIFIFKGF